MKKLVTLVNPNRFKPRVAPIALDYLYKPLSEAGFDVKILDLHFADDVKAAIASYCQANDTDFWGITMRNSDDGDYARQESFIHSVKEVIQSIKKYSDSPIIMGGVGFSSMPETMLNLCEIDFGILCEGEYSFPELLLRLANGKRYDDISGLVYRTENGFNRNPVSYIDLANSGVHHRNLVDNRKYFNEGGEIAIGIETKRGCNRRCIYCLEPSVKGSKIRLREPSDVVDEIEQLFEQGINAFFINDSEFNLNVKHAIAFCREIRHRKFQNKIKWHTNVLPKPLPDQLVKEMSDSGCRGVNITASTASDKMLHIYKHNFIQKDIAEALETMKRHNLKGILDLLLGGPGETGETVKESIQFCKKINADYVMAIMGIRIFPGTPLAQMALDEGISSENNRLYGVVENNNDFIQPMFYISDQIAPDPFEYLKDLIGGDKRFYIDLTSYPNFS